jgi:pimeloyl-ACP methyl ester carboxylesterase
VSEAKERLFYFFVAGLGHDKWAFADMSARLEQLGHQTDAVGVSIVDPEATFDEYSEAIIERLPDDDNIVLCGWSRAGNVLPRIAAEVAIRRMVFINSAPDTRILPPDMVKGLDPPERLTPGYQQALKRAMDESGMVRLKSDDVKDLLYHDCPPVVLPVTEPLIKPQRRREERQQLKEWPETPSAAIYGREDKVINPKYLEFFAREILRVEPVELDCGHAPSLAIPDVAANALVKIG